MAALSRSLCHPKLCTCRAPAARACGSAQPAPDAPAVLQLPAPRPGHDRRAGLPVRQPELRCHAAAKHRRPGLSGSGLRRPRSAPRCVHNALLGCSREESEGGGHGQGQPRQSVKGQHASVIATAPISSEAGRQAAAPLTQQHLRGRNKIVQQPGEAPHQRRQPSQLLCSLQG